MCSARLQTTDDNKALISLSTRSVAPCLPEAAAAAASPSRCSTWPGERLSAGGNAWLRKQSFTFPLFSGLQISSARRCPLVRGRRLYLKTRPCGGDAGELGGWGGGELQPFCLGTESEEIIILFLAEKRSVQPGLDASYQKVPKVPSRLGPQSVSDDSADAAALPRLFRSIAAGPPLCLPKVDSQSGNTPAVVCAVFRVALFLRRHLSPLSQENVVHMYRQQTVLRFASTRKQTCYSPFYFMLLLFFLISGIINFQPS